MLDWSGTYVHTHTYIRYEEAKEIVCNLYLQGNQFITLTVYDTTS